MDHPCKQTCSGWQQGYDKGYSARDAEVKALRDIVKRCLHARQCNAPYGQTEKYPTVSEMQRALKQHGEGK